MNKLGKIIGFDCDGVITVGIYPGPDDVIITGRSFEERPETEAMLRKKGIGNKVFYNPLPYEQKTRESSGEHKANVLLGLKEQGTVINVFFEDDEIQKEIIESRCPWITVVHVVHNLTNKENERHLEDFESLELEEK